MLLIKGNLTTIIACKFCFLFLHQIHTFVPLNQWLTYCIFHVIISRNLGYYSDFGFDVIRGNICTPFCSNSVTTYKDMHCQHSALFQAVSTRAQQTGRKCLHVKSEMFFWVSRNLNFHNLLLQYVNKRVWEKSRWEKLINIEIF